MNEPPRSSDAPLPQLSPTDPIQYISWRDSPSSELWLHRITRAEPRALISATLLESATQPERLQHSAQPASHYLDLTNWDHDGVSILILRDDCGQEFIYRVVDYDAEQDTWLIEWPD